MTAPHEPQKRESMPRKKKPTEPVMTPKLRAFAQAYAGRAKGNATEAARMAGYSGSDAQLAVRGSECVRNRKVQALIAELERETRSKAIADREEIQTRLTAIGRGKGKEPHVLQNGGVVKTGPTFAARTAALLAVAKMRGYLVDKIEVKAADQMKAQLEQLRKRMTPEAFEQLLEAIVSEE